MRLQINSTLKEMYQRLVEIPSLRWEYNDGDLHIQRSNSFVEVCFKVFTYEWVEVSFQAPTEYKMSIVDVDNIHHNFNKLFDVFQDRISTIREVAGRENKSLVNKEIKDLSKRLKDLKKIVKDL